MKRQQVLALINKHTKNRNLVRHMVAVAACMGVLAKHFGEDQEKWELAGLLHDADYEETKDNDPKKNHTKLVIEWLEKYDVLQEVKEAILAHGWQYVDGAPEPKTKMEWALYTCDELTGLIVAVALVKGGKLEDVEVKSVMKKWNQKAFAAGANRKQIALCEEKLGIKLEEFIEICLGAMKNISSDLGL
jgi:putative nucleotidyltransferase with HDIG domain